MLNLKQELYALCTDYINNKEADIRKVIDEAREAANNETKSSAGDKYETGRETMQQEIDLNLTRLNELKKLKVALDRILPDQKSGTVVPGSAVFTNNGNYYIAISAGVLKVGGLEFYAVSAASPIGNALTGKKVGDSFSWNGKQYTVAEVK